MPVVSGEVRHYRSWIRPSGDLVGFRVVYKESDLFVVAERDLSLEVLALLKEVRAPLEDYILRHPEFLTALKPLRCEPDAPSIVKKMVEASSRVGVGPMASVAGAIAQRVGEELLRRELTSQVVVENGGDIFLALKKEAKVALYAGSSPLSGKIAIKVKSELMPCGVCTSSAKVGHSLSLGAAEAVCVVARDAAFADAAATALCNLAKGKRSVDRVVAEARKYPEIEAVVCVVEDRLGLYGRHIEVVPL